MSSVTPLECVAFILVERDRVLAEKRSMAKRLCPGAVALPGGHLEADDVRWVPLEDVAALDLDVDRTAIEAYVRSRTVGARS